MCDFIFGSNTKSIKCYCGNLIGRYGMTNDCKIKCNNANETCGGSFTSSIYATNMEYQQKALTCKGLSLS